MSGSIYDELKERGFIAQVSDEAAVRRKLDREQTTFYIGFDSTAASLHAGSLVPIMAMVHLRRAGHRAIALIGGGTTMVGDPSGKTEMRQMLDEERIRAFGALDPGPARPLPAFRPAGRRRRSTTPTGCCR